MDVQIRALTPALLPDYLDYFDHVAFVDHAEWSGCYCVHFHWNDRMEAEYPAYAASGGTCFNRDYAVRYIQDGTLQGYLAYADGRVVGWCNANDKARYDSLAREKRPELWADGGAAGDTKAVVCFAIAPPHRGKGIATQLLARVCQDARAQGYAHVEAYPCPDETDVYINHYGPYALYERCGFRPVKRLEHSCIVRLAL